MTMKNVAWGTYDHRDIRTCYPNELAYLKGMRKRYACQFCGNNAMTCPGCQQRDARIAELEEREA